MQKWKKNSARILPIWSSMGRIFLYNGECVHAYALPMEFNSDVGRLPSCRGKSSGNYQYQDRPCDAYYKCEQGVASAVKCPNNTVFDTKKGICDVKGICNWKLTVRNFINKSLWKTLKSVNWIAKEVSKDQEKYKLQVIHFSFCISEKQHHISI